MDKNNLLDYTPIFNIQKLKGLLKICITCPETENNDKISFLAILSNFNEDKKEISVRVIHGEARILLYFNELFISGHYNKYNKTYTIKASEVESGDIEISPIEISY